MFVTVPASNEDFLVDLATRALKNPHTIKCFERIRRKFDKSWKNRQVQGKVKLELSKIRFKRCLKN